MRGGGVLIAVSNRFSSSELIVEDNCGLEQLWVSLNGGSRKIVFGVVYIPPDESCSVSLIEHHVNCVCEISEKLQPQDFLLMFGDYNQPGLLWKTSDSGTVCVDSDASTFSVANTALIDGMAILDMTQMNNLPNRMNRTLDLLFVNSSAPNQCDVMLAADMLVDADEFHPPVSVSLKCPPLVRFTEIVNDEKLDFRRTDYAGLNAALMAVDWSFLELSNVNRTVELFNQCVNNLLVQFVPKIRKKQRPVWSNSRLRRLKRIRAAALKRYCATEMN